MQNFDFAPDPWLTRVLNIQCIKISATSISDYIEWKKQAILDREYFITIKTDSGTFSDLECSDSQLVLIQQMNQYSWNSDPKHHNLQDFRVRSSTTEDIEEILAIGSNSFGLSRFHKDPRISHQVSEEIKRKWLLSNLTSRKNCETLVVLNPREEIVGFCSLLIQIDYMVIDLISIYPTFRRKGLGRLLVSGAQRAAEARNLPLTVGT